MKKLLYLTAFVVLTSIVSSCTEENIKPQGNGNGSVQESPWN